MTVLLALVACRHDDELPLPPVGAPSPLLGVEETESYEFPGLHGPAYVIRAEGSIPYVYAQDREDLAFVAGFTVARDRFFVMDLERRLAEGRLSEILGDAALTADQEARGTGMTRVTDRVLALFDADPGGGRPPEWAGIMDAYAAGIDQYVEQVAAGRQLVPSEYAQLGPILGRTDPADMLTPWDRRDMAAVAATLIYNLGFETTDIGRAEAYDAVPSLFVGAPNEALRRAGVLDDILAKVDPVYPTSSAPGWGPTSRSAGPRGSAVDRHLRVPADSYARLRTRMTRFERWFGHDRESGFGSNAWAVGGYASADGRALLAGDGHLGLSVPPLFYDIGMDTALLGGDGGDGDIHQVGLVLPGFPTLAVGTNGRVAWSQTQLFGDITDWYREELILGADGRPVAARFQGDDVPLVRVDESYVVADVPLLGSTGRTETWPRWETADGRLIAEIEGTPADAETAGVVNVQGVFVVPGDVDGDGVVTAISFDYTAFDDGNLVLASDGFGRADDVDEFREATKRLVAYSQNLVAADANGDILYTGYQAVPCRDYLPRKGDGSFADGADPMRLIDGTTYGGFTIPVLPDGTVDETQGDDPYGCVVPFEAYPQSVSPEQGYVLTANNDIGNISTDGNLFDDPYYVGGPWIEGYRANRIDQVLADHVAAGDADIAAMSALQGDHHSVVAEQLLPTMLEAFDAGRAAAAGSPEVGSPEERIAALWTANQARLEDVEQRLRAWQDAGLPAESGVETDYDPLEPGEDALSVATTLWNVWVGEFVAGTFDDEGFPSVWYPTGDTGKTRTLKRMLATRGATGADAMASADPATGESVYFDVLSTPEVESSTELMLSSLVVALDRMTAPPTGDATGGFGTADLDEWRWGYRHLAKFESILTELFDEGEDFGLIALFSITPDDVPIADGLSASDPRASLPWFPRRGDHLNVDAGNSGFSRDEWMYGSGPVFRLVVALGPDGAEAVNVLPGGQSALTTSPYWADQAPLWLGNQTLPLRTTVDDVIAGAVGRETFLPAE